MCAKSFIRIAMTVMLATLSGQTLSAPGPGRPARLERPRIVVTPRPFHYRRRCTDWLELQYRPSGPVIYPQYRCWWEWQ